VLELGEWFGPVIDALGKPSLRVPFMMRSRRSNFADEQLKEVIGSGPFRFVKDEWQPAARPSTSAIPAMSAQRALADRPVARTFLDKVLWRYIPDQRDGSVRLAQGEVDLSNPRPIPFRRSNRIRL